MRANRAHGLAYFLFATVNIVLLALVSILIHSNRVSIDFGMLQAAFLLLTFSVILFNLVADLLYFKLDPRITE